LEHMSEEAEGGEDWALLKEPGIVKYHAIPEGRARKRCPYPTRKEKKR